MGWFYPLPVGIGLKAYLLLQGLNTVLCTQINDYIVMVDAQPLVHTYLDTHSRTYERSDSQPTIKVIAIEELWL